MNELQLIDERLLFDKQFRIYGTPEEPLFLAKDVGIWLEYNVSNIKKLISNVDEGEKVRYSIPTLGGNQESWFLTEDGFFEILMQSTKPIAKQFKTEVKKILKDIRKHGMYMTDATVEQILSNPEQLGRMLIDYAEKKQRLVDAEKQIEYNKPKVIFADAVDISEDSISVGAFAKILKQNGVDTGQNKLYKWFRTNGYLISRKSDWNIPTQYSMNLGLFEIKELLANRSNHRRCLYKTTYITGHGQLYFVNKFLNITAVA